MSLLILREEFVCLVVIAFILSYTTIYKIKTDNNCFFRILIYSLGHVVFDIITVLTVNHQEMVPRVINDLCHIAFYAFSIMFVMAYYEYIVLQVASIRLHKITRVFKFVPAAIYAITAYFFPIEYVEGNGTNYSYGPLAFIGYGVFVVYCLSCCILVVFNHKKMETRKKLTIYPMTFLMVVLVVVQALVPELLMTSAGVTFVCLGLFASFNNPAKEYREQAYWDAATGIKNKNGYKQVLEKMEKKYIRKKFTVGFLVCDMNGLKVINDNYGHIEGDKLLRAAASALKEQLIHAYDVYRVGGDEFVAVYIEQNDALVERDIENVRKACDAYKDSPIILSIAMGYASGVYSEDYMNIYNKADEAMYADKVEIKEKHPELCGR